MHPQVTTHTHRDKGTQASFCKVNDSTKAIAHHCSARQSESRKVNQSMQKNTPECLMCLFSVGERDKEQIDGISVHLPVK